VHSIWDWKVSLEAVEMEEMEEVEEVEEPARWWWWK
jgi:hypothetical protein